MGHGQTHLSLRSTGRSQANKRIKACFLVKTAWDLLKALCFFPPARAGNSQAGQGQALVKARLHQSSGKGRAQPCSFRSTQTHMVLNTGHTLFQRLLTSPGTGTMPGTVTKISYIRNYYKVAFSGKNQPLD